jgi:hypothetical protein
MTPSDGVQRGHLQAEERSAQGHSIDYLDTVDLCMAFNYQESGVFAQSRIVYRKSHDSLMIQ